MAVLYGDRTGRNARSGGPQWSAICRLQFAVAGRVVGWVVVDGSLEGVGIFLEILVVVLEVNLSMIYFMGIYVYWILVFFLI